MKKTLILIASVLCLILSLFALTACFDGGSDEHPVP